MSPFCTIWPSRTSIDRTIAVSSGCTTLVADCATTLPCVVTTLSIGISAAAAMQAAAKEPTTQIVPRAACSTGVTASAAVGE